MGRLACDAITMSRLRDGGCEGNDASGVPGGREGADASGVADCARAKAERVDNGRSSDDERPKKARRDTDMVSSRGHRLLHRGVWAIDGV